jgi:hypothetical protein
MMDMNNVLKTLTRMTRGWILGQWDLLGGYHRIQSPTNAANKTRNLNLVRGWLSIWHNIDFFQKLAKELHYEIHLAFVEITRLEHCND